MPFNNSSHFVVSEPTFIVKNIVNNGISDIHFLYQHAARGASYDSKDKFDKPKCDPETRVKLLSDIHDWIKIPDKETGITLLHGPAGSGKSCIARSTCEQAASEGLLGASFFFWRSSSSRNNESLFVTTIAYQLVQGNEELGRYILSEIAQNPHVIELSLEEQFRRLIINPCLMLPREKLSARVIVIDGLDECMGEETQICILQMLARAVRHEGFPLGFFVTSRPELHIQEALDSKELIFATKDISLNQVPGVLQDIQTVLESGFLRILNNPRFKRTLKSVPRPWPTPENIDQLVRRSSGQFIYAATVLKYISDLDSNPASLLEIVLGIKEYESSVSESPLANLDLLYHEIMSRVKHPELSRKVLSCVLAIKDLRRRKIINTKREYGKLTFAPDITRAVLHNQNRLLLVIEQLLELSDGTAYLALNQLHSLVSLKVNSESTRRHLEIDFYHKSFEDYLTTKKRSTTFHIDVKKAHNELAHLCLKFMGLPRYETESHHVGWVYACFQWNVHRKTGGRNMGILGHNAALQRFTSGLTDYLDVTNLNGALHILGLSGGPWTVLFNNIQKFGLIHSDSLIHALNDVRRLMGHVSYPYRAKEPTDLTMFDKMYTYPVWRKTLLSYSNDTQSIKLFILVFHLTRWTRISEISESETCEVLSALGLISDELQQSSVVVSRYKDIEQQLSSLVGGWWELEKLITTAEPHEAFHCASEVISDVYAAIISTGVWRNYMWDLCSRWSDSTEFTASSSLLSCLKSEALEFHDNLELNRKLTSSKERYFFIWLRQKVQGQTEDVIQAWERAFDRARSLFPDNFKNRWGNIVPRE